VNVLPLLFPLLLSAPSPAVVEEVVFKVNDRVVTRSEYLAREQATLAGLRRVYKGPDLEAKVREVKDRLLDTMLEDTLLLEYAYQRYDVSKIVDYQIESLRKERNLEDDAAFHAFLRREGVSEEELRRRVESYFVPEFVRSREIRSEIRISTAEIKNYLEAHREELRSSRRWHLLEIGWPVAEVSREEAEARARDIRARVKSGEKFEELAKRWKARRKDAETVVPGTDIADRSDEVDAVVGVPEQHRPGPLCQQR